MNWQVPDAPPRTKTTAPVKALKIIVQYRSKQGKVYELQSAGTVVTVCIAYHGEASDPSACRVEAQTQAPSGLAKVEASASTPAAALIEVSRAWRATSPALPPFDWDAVTRELEAVGAF